ncbi:ComF family protein [Azoarcus sp. KH32C]|uniref:ComF family protein n=1 Tax=Azoarcus sp. KH32C TaxID=748247 RepID=UPI0002386C3A|nr:ComF family protein [Azoarcus sp. KH32C]BAL23331.1 hypothetical protein AZKH_0995 [Azoarcus sp. KH32C]
MIRAVSAFVSDRLLPNDCFVCGCGAGRELLCERCRGELPLAYDCCPVCAIPVKGGAVCGSCQREPPAFDASVAALSYLFPADRLLQALKYGGRLAVSQLLAQLLLEWVAPAEEAVLVPMPLHERRLRERGFNQAVEIARPLARAWKLPLELEAVRRVRDTVSQATLPWSRRRVNMRGAFRCDTSFAGKTVIVIDDVMTTGATLDELARTLKASGAARVENCVVARTPSPV